MPVQQIAIVVPVYNDWPSFSELLCNIDGLLAASDIRAQLIVINDGSSMPSTGLPESWRRIERIDIHNLVCNLGHQRAIAIGLVAAESVGTFDGVIVMDADGEDRPEEISRLVSLAERHPDHIVCAQRTRRSESYAFIVFYRLYQLLFRAFTGKTIDFGNFCFVPNSVLKSLIYNSSLWNNLPATIVRSRIPYVKLSSVRGKRYAGTSTMNYAALVLHGLSAISVFSDIALARLLIFMSILGISTVPTIVGVVVLRLTTNLATPGWATQVVGALAVIFLQSLVFGAISAFMLLSLRGTKAVIPALDAQQYLLSKMPLARTAEPSWTVAPTHPISRERSGSLRPGVA
jgi:hypothetical protein